MPKFRVLIREIHISHREVEAESEAEAMTLAGDAEEVYLEYGHTLDQEYWTVENA